jgi:hypothetical protein
MKPVSERLLRAGNSEERSPCAIEHQHAVAQPVDDWIPVECHKSASGERATYRRSPTAAGGTAPIRTSRVMPPALPAAEDGTGTPNGSRRSLTRLARR